MSDEYRDVAVYILYDKNNSPRYVVSRFKQDESDKIKNDLTVNKSNQYCIIDVHNNIRIFNAQDISYIEVSTQGELLDETKAVLDMFNSKIKSDAKAINNRSLLRKTLNENDIKNAIRLTSTIGVSPNERDNIDELLKEIEDEFTSLLEEKFSDRALLLGGRGEFIEVEEVED